MKCDVCTAEVVELRRGRCWGCYTRWVDERPVGRGARCCICGERRRTVLKNVELLGAFSAICYNCHGQAARLEPLPDSIEGIRDALCRERRRRERRLGKSDTRVFQYERRLGDRRGGEPDDEAPAVDDAMIVDAAELDAAEPLDACDMDFDDGVELTRIHLPAPPLPGR